MEEEISVVMLRSDNTQYNSWKGVTTNTRKVNDKNLQWFCGRPAMASPPSVLRRPRDPAPLLAPSASTPCCPRPWRRPLHPPTAARSYPAWTGRHGPELHVYSSSLPPSSPPRGCCTLAAPHLRPAATPGRATLCRRPSPHGAAAMARIRRRHEHVPARPRPWLLRPVADPCAMPPLRHPPVAPATCSTR